MPTTASPKSTSFKKALFLIGLLSVLLFLFIASSKFLNYINSKEKVAVDKIFTNSDYSGLKNYAKKEGIDSAYSLLKKQFSNNEPAAHDFAHIIGIVAYEQKKMPGISVCDSAYNYGCMHGFMQAFLAENSLDEISQVENACAQLGSLHAPSCWHGIGHGVMIESGYDLDVGLLDCQRLTTRSQIYCFDGVFMERIVQSMVPGERKNLIDKDNLDSPCRDVSYIYRSQCWRNQTTLWFSHFSNKSQEVGKRCLLVEPEFMQICTESIGLKVAMSAPPSAQSAATSCTFSKNSVSDDCLIGVMKELMFENKLKNIASQLCQYISAPQRTNCQNLFNQLEGENQSRFKT